MGILNYRYKVAREFSQPAIRDLAAEDGWIWEDSEAIYTEAFQRLTGF